MDFFINRKLSSKLIRHEKIEKLSELNEIKNKSGLAIIDSDMYISLVLDNLI